MEYFEKINSFDDEPITVAREGSAAAEIPLTVGESIKAFFVNHFTKQGAVNTAKNIFPSKSQHIGENIRRSVRIVATVCLVVALVYIIDMYGQHRSRIRLSDELDKIVQEYEDIEPAQLEEAWKNIKAQYPDVDFPEGMNIAFAPLYAINKDIVGKLTIPNTNISTNVMQNGNRYLYRDFYGKESRYGMPFADASASLRSGNLPKNTIIYGHNTHDGLMFNQLTNFMSVDGYKNSPVIIFNTLYKTTKWKVFAVILTNSTEEADNGYYYDFLRTGFASDNDFMSYISEVKVRNMINTNVDVKPSDRIMTLYTCYQSIFEGGRLLIFAREIREGESETVDTSRVYYNSSARFPQAYYDAKELENPYYNGEETTTEKQTEAPAKPSAPTQPTTTGPEPGSAAELPTDAQPTAAPTQPQPETQPETPPTQPPPETQPEQTAAVIQPQPENNNTEAVISG